MWWTHHSHNLSAENDEIRRCRFSPDLILPGDLATLSAFRDLGDHPWWNELNIQIRSLDLQIREMSHLTHINGLEWCQQYSVFVPIYYPQEHKHEPSRSLEHSSNIDHLSCVDIYIENRWLQFSKSLFSPKSDTTVGRKEVRVRQVRLEMFY